VDLEDVAEMTAKVVAEGSLHHFATYELRGDDFRTAPELAEIISSESGRPVTAELASPTGHGSAKAPPTEEEDYRADAMVSAGSAGSVATSALVNTQIGASAAMLSWMTIEWIRRRKPSGVGIASGAIAGLAAITPASGYVPTWAALVIGGAAGLLCYEAVQLKSHLRYDDALDVVGVHMVGGFAGVVLKVVDCRTNASARAEGFLGYRATSRCSLA
jgi:hypothetical protein